MHLTLDQRLTQKQLGELVGIGQQAVSTVSFAAGIAHDASVGQWLKAYCRRLRESAAGRLSDGELSLVQERAALARAQRVAVDMRIATLRAEYAPALLLAGVLASASTALAERLDGLYARLQATAPGMDDAAREAIERLISATRDEWLRSTQRLAIEPLDDRDGVVLHPTVKVLPQNSGRG